MELEKGIVKRENDRNNSSEVVAPEDPANRLADGREVLVFLSWMEKKK